MYKNCRVKCYSFLSILDIISKISLQSKNERELCKQIKYHTNENFSVNLNFHDNQFPHIQDILFMLELSNFTKIKICKLDYVYNRVKLFDLFNELNKRNLFGKVQQIKFVQCTILLQFCLFQETLMNEFSEESLIKLKTEVNESLKLNNPQIIFETLSFKGELEFLDCRIDDSIFLSIFRNARIVIFNRTRTKGLKWFGNIFQNLDQIHLENVNYYQVGKDLFTSFQVKTKQNYKKFQLCIEIDETDKERITLLGNYSLNDKIMRKLNIQNNKSMETILNFVDYVKFSKCMDYIQSHRKKLQICFKTDTLIWDYASNMNNFQNNREFSNQIDQTKMQDLIEELNNLQRIFQYQITFIESGEYSNCLKITKTGDKKYYNLFFNQMRYMTNQ